MRSAREFVLLHAGTANDIPSPATHAILLQLKAGETAGSYIRSVKDTFRHYIGCVRHFLTLYSVYKTLSDTFPPAFNASGLRGQALAAQAEEDAAQAEEEAGGAEGGAEGGGLGAGELGDEADEALLLLVGVDGDEGVVDAEVGATERDDADHRDPEPVVDRPDASRARGRLLDAVEET